MVNEASISTETPLNDNSEAKYSFAQYWVLTLHDSRMGVAIGQSITGNGLTADPIKAKDGILIGDEDHQGGRRVEARCFRSGLPLDMDGSENEMCQRAP